MKTSELAYPVLAVHPEGEFFVAADEDWLTTLHSGTFKKGGRNGWTIIDSEGVAVIVLDTKYVSGKGPFWGWTVFLDRILRVSLTLGEPFEISLEDIKAKIVREIKKVAKAQDPDYWIEPLRNLQETKSIRDLIQLLLPDWDIRKLY